MNPFDLPGPEFLLLYVSLFVLLLVARKLPTLTQRTPAAYELSNSPLSPYEVAFMTGGRAAVVDAALASLTRRGLLDPNLRAPASAVNAALPKRGSADAGEFDHQIELELLESTRSGSVRLNALRKHLPTGIQRLEGKLVQLGLVTSETWRSRYFWINAAPFFALAVAGIAKVIIGINRGRPVSFLVMLVTGTIICATYFARSQLPRLTKSGRLRVEQMRDQYEALRLTAVSAPGQALPSELAMAYALFGTSILVGPLLGLGAEIRSLGSSVDEEIAAAQARLKSSFWQNSGDSSGSSCGSSSGSSCSGGSSSCGGSSCGGGGCGGGGCGGCGGG